MYLDLWKIMDHELLSRVVIDSCFLVGISSERIIMIVLHHKLPLWVSEFVIPIDSATSDSEPRFQGELSNSWEP